MGIKRWDAARDANEREIVKWLTHCGASVERLDQPLDLLVGFRGETYLLEVKLPGQQRRLTKGQEAFIRHWRGSPCYVVTTPQEALAAIGIEYEP